MNFLSKIHPLVWAAILGFVGYELCTWHALLIAVPVAAYLYVQYGRHESEVVARAGGAERYYIGQGALLGLIVAEAAIIIPLIFAGTLGIRFGGAWLLNGILFGGIWGAILGAAAAYGTAWRAGRARWPITGAAAG